MVRLCSKQPTLFRDGGRTDRRRNIMAKRIDFQKAAKRAYEEQRYGRWYELLDQLDEIVKLKPWKYVRPSDTFAYMPQNGNQNVVFFNCVRSGGVLGIVVYPSENAYYNVLRGQQSGKEERRQFIEMESYSIFLGDKEQVPAPMMNIFRRIGVDFGDGMWPWIACKHRGYVTRTPNEEDIVFLADAIRNFGHQLSALLEKGLRVDFNRGEMLMRLFDVKKGGWENAAVPFLPPQEEYPVIVLREENNPQFKTLRACPVSASVPRMELEFGWKENPVQDEPNTTPYFPAVVALANRLTNEPLASYTCRPEDLNDCAYSLLAEAIETYGLPETLYVSQKETAQMFEDFTKKLNIKLKQVKRVPAAAQILRVSEAIV